MRVSTDLDLAVHGGPPVREDFLVYGRPRIEEPEIEEVVRTLQSGWLGTGPKVHEFEQRFARYIGVRHAIALNSCTAGLHLALTVLGTGPGDEVITTPMTFGATANVIVHCGGTPVFVDVDRYKMTIDPAAVEEAITPRTKGILPVHFGGRPCEMDALKDIADRHGLWIIEDAAHAIETTFRDCKVGTIGDFTSFSFYVTKNIITGEGGMLTTDNAEWAERARMLSLHGLSRDAWARYAGNGDGHYEVLEPGFKYNMMDMQAAIGIHQLDRIKSCYERRKQIWERYDKAFLDLPVFLLPPLEDPGSRHALHLYTLLLDLDRLTQDRDFVRAALKGENIGTGIHYTALHLHAYYRNRFGFTRGIFPNTEWISDRTLSLPLGVVMTDTDVEDVITAVRKVVNHIRR